MSKAEDRALEAFPLNINGDSRGSYDLNVVKRIIYQQGYEQAEKDLELTWEDIEAIDQIFTDVFKDGFDVTTNKYYQEVLNRFNKQKGE